MKTITSTLILQLNVQLANSIGFNGLFSGLKSEKSYLTSHADSSCNSQAAVSVLVVAFKLNGGTRFSYSASLTRW